MRGVPLLALRPPAIFMVVGLSLLAGCSSEIYSGIEEREGNLMIAELSEAGIPATRSKQKDGKLVISVADDDFARSVRVLDAAGLPKEKFATLGEVFQSDSIVASPVQERARMLFALSEELSRTISDIDGVLNARVHVVLPDNDPLRGQLTPSSASVFIRHTVTTDVGPLIPQIKTLVSNSISGLAYDRVSIVPVASVSPVRHTAGSTPQMASFLGVSMPEASVDRMRAVFGVLLACCVLASGLLLYKLRPAQNRVFALGDAKKD